jgi:hypothetical protein
MTVNIKTAGDPDPRSPIFVWLTERYGPVLFLDPDDAAEFLSAYGGKVEVRYAYGSGEREMPYGKVKQMAHRFGG